MRERERERKRERERETIFHCTIEKFPIICTVYESSIFTDNINHFL